MTTQNTDTADRTATTAATTADARSRPVVPGVRLAVEDLAPHLSRAMHELEAAARDTRLEASLLELVRTRASQLNGCAYCVDMHTQDARKAGESERRLHALAVWRETPFFTARERAALELTEAGTRLSEGPVSDEVYSRAAGHFTDAELAELVWAIAVINTWNRLGTIARPWPLT